MQYLRNEKLFDKFNKAFSEGKLILINGATGLGKTAFIEEALKDKDYNYVSLRKNYDSITNNKKILVIDDFQYIVDKEHLLNDIVNEVNKAKNAIVISRSDMTNTFVDAIVSKGVLTIRETDLVFNREMVNRLFEKKLTKEQLDFFENNAMGFPLIFLFLANKVKEGEQLGPSLLQESREVYAQRLKTAVFDYIDPSVLYFLLQVSVVDDFDIETAIAITLNDRCKALASKAMKYGNFLFKKGDTYQIRNLMLYTLRKLSYLYYSLQEYNEFRFNAAHYYEEIGKIDKALALYEKCESKSSIKRILVYNSLKTPANGEFKLLKRYYEMLTEEEVYKNPILLCGMSMLYSLFLDVEKSEHYYGLLKEKLENAVGAEYNEISNLIDYLDVALPQRGVNSIFSILANNLKKGVADKGTTTTFGLTGNCPSIINGGKDFTLYLKDYETILDKYSPIISQAMGGEYNKGILSTLKAECMYETGEDQIKLMQAVVKAKMEIDKKQVDYNYVLTRIVALTYMERGKIVDARNSIDELLKQVSNEDNPHLKDNILALKVILYILEDNKDEVKKWLDSKTKESASFFTLDRIEYMSQIYAYIYFEQYSEAFVLLQKLKYYAKAYDRAYILAECHLLEALINYHTEKNYVDSLYEGLKICEERRLLRIISSLGAAMDKMIYQQRDKLLEMGISNNFLIDLNPLLLNVSTRYPHFLNKEDNVIPKLSKLEIMILQLQSQGYSLNMVSDRLQVNIETIRYHAKQNYKKLGAAGGPEAVAIAKKYGII